MKALPYFRWYPADAETDEAFRTMSDTDIGYYMRCLNYAWINGSIPADSKERARLMRVHPNYDQARWSGVGPRWNPHPTLGGRLVNTRQEWERDRATTRSLKASESAKAHSERSASEKTDAAPRAYDSDSSAPAFKEKGVQGEKQRSRWKFDEHFARFATDYLSTGGNFIDADFHDAYEHCWRKLSFEDRLERVAGLNRHMEEYASTEARYIPKPRKFLEIEWERPPRATAASGQFPQRKDSLADRTIALVQRRIANGERPL